LADGPPPLNNNLLQWQLFYIGTDEGGDKFAIKSVSSGLFLDGRLPGQTGDELYYTDRDPLNDPDSYGGFGLSQYLWWYLENYGGGENYVAFKSFSSGSYLDGRDANIASGSNPYLTASSNPSNNDNLKWNLEFVREWKNLEWFSSPSLKPSQRFALYSISSRNYVQGRECRKNIINGIYMEPGPPQNDTGYEIQIARSGDGFTFTTSLAELSGGCHLDGRTPDLTGDVVGLAGKPISWPYFIWYPVDIGSNRFAMKSKTSGHLLNGRDDVDTGLNGVYLDGSGTNPKTTSYLQWQIVYLYG